MIFDLYKEWEYGKIIIEKFKDVKVYHQIRRQPYLARLVGKYHTIQTESAIHTILLYEKNHLITIRMLGVFRILFKSLSYRYEVFGVDAYILTPRS